MPEYLDTNATVDLECLNCGKPFKKTIRELKNKPKFLCPAGCGVEYNAADFNTGIKRANKDIEDFSRNLGRLFK